MLKKLNRNIDKKTIFWEKTKAMIGKSGKNSLQEKSMEVVKKKEFWTEGHLLKIFILQHILFDRELVEVKKMPEERSWKEKKKWLH